MQQRATSEMMRLRRSTAEHPFASLKYRIFGHPRFLLRGRTLRVLGGTLLHSRTNADDESHIGCGYLSGAESRWYADARRDIILNNED